MESPHKRFIIRAKLGKQLHLMLKGREKERGIRLPHEWKEAVKEERGDGETEGTGGDKMGNI